jgi:hypothetical protein
VDHLLHHLVHHLLHLVNDMDLTMLVLHLFLVGNYLFQFQHLQDVLHLDALQNLDAQNLDELLPFLDEVLRFLVVAVVGVEPQHLLRKDYFQDVVGVEPHCLLRKDYFLDEASLELLVLLVQVLLLLHLLLPLPLPVQPFQHRVMPSALQDRHRVLLQALLLTLDLLQQSFWRQRSSWQLPS